MGLQMTANRGVAMTLAGGVTTITTKIEGNGTTMGTDTVDTKDTTSLTISVAGADTTDTARPTHSQATTQPDTNQTMAALTKMAAAGVAIVAAVATTAAMTDHVAAVLGVGCRTITTTAASTDNRATCGTRSRKEGTAVGADHRSDMKHGY